MNLRTLAVGTLALSWFAPGLVAGDKPLRHLFGPVAPAPKPAKPYPMAENRYIKQFAGPTLSCGACFGYYPTQWRPWGEACGEPQVIESVLPTDKPMAPAAPALEKPREQPPAPMPSVPKLNVPEKPAPEKPAPEKPAPVSPTDPGKTSVSPLPVIPSPLPATPPQLALPTIPTATAIPELPVESAPAIPTIIVPLNSK